MKAPKPPRKKKTVQALLKNKRRDQRKKGQRLARRALTETIKRLETNQRTYANVVCIRRDGNLLFGMRTGLFGHPTTTTLKVEDEKIVGAVEDTKELGEIVTQLGLLTLGALVNYNLAWGPEGLAKALARWAHIDLSELEAKAEAEALEAVKASIEAKQEQEAEAAALTASEEEPEPPADQVIDLGGEG